MENFSLCSEYNSCCGRHGAYPPQKFGGGGILEHFGTEKAILELKVTKISYVRMMAIILYDGYDFVSMI